MSLKSVPIVVMWTYFPNVKWRVLRIQALLRMSNAQGGQLSWMGSARTLPAMVSLSEPKSSVNWPTPPSGKPPRMPSLCSELPVFLISETGAHPLPVTRTHEPSARYVGRWRPREVISTLKNTLTHKHIRIELLLLLNAIVFYLMSTPLNSKLYIMIITTI